MARTIRFSSCLKELRIHLCQKSPSSKGVREFIEKSYVPIKKENPKFPILIRECSGIEPIVWARYDYGEEKCVPLSFLEQDCVYDTIKNLSS
ncbi:NADH dehydrogenase (ubiquinone) B8 subunit [Lycorma delicatula]|uniref:NADH dehydrogenase (ubiquinone) B8 subunit n=1 Tax=Lycorma delicatula TaxID=130591 RepID=UPI003F51481B